MTSKWCPECKAYHEHIGTRCVGCDLNDSDLTRLVKAEKSPVSLEQALEQIMNEQSKDDWMKEEWVVAMMDEGPAFAGETKGECVEYASACADSKDETTERVRTGLYRYEPDDDQDRVNVPCYWIGRPSAFEEQGCGYMLDPDHYD